MQSELKHGLDLLLHATEKFFECGNIVRESDNVQERYHFFGNQGI